jgi:DNA-binding transcriptional regulator YdaS (Cro superfamily)
MHNFDIVKQAGITPGIVARLVGVSRVTASQWVNGHAKPHKLLESRVAEFLAIVAAGVEQKLLPVTPYPGRKNIMTATSAALVQAARQRQAAKNDTAPI